MAAPTLRHYYARTNSAAGNTTTTLVTVPANRALAISKITVSNVQTVSISFVLQIGTEVGTGQSVAYGVILAPSETYSETGLVALAGEVVSVFVFTASANALDAHVFGQEVDNV